VLTRAVAARTRSAFLTGFELTGVAAIVGQLSRQRPYDSTHRLVQLASMSQGHTCNCMRAQVWIDHERLVRVQANFDHKLLTNAAAPVPLAAAHTALQDAQSAYFQQQDSHHSHLENVQRLQEQLEALHVAGKLDLANDVQHDLRRAQEHASTSAIRLAELEQHVQNTCNAAEHAQLLDMLASEHAAALTHRQRLSEHQKESANIAAARWEKVAALQAAASAEQAAASRERELEHSLAEQVAQQQLGSAQQPSSAGIQGAGSALQLQLADVRRRAKRLRESALAKDAERKACKVEADHAQEAAAQMASELRVWESGLQMSTKLRDLADRARGAACKAQTARAQVHRLEAQAQSLRSQLAAWQAAAKCAAQEGRAADARAEQHAADELAQVVKQAQAAGEAAQGRADALQAQEVDAAAMAAAMQAKHALVQHLQEEMQHAAQCSHDAATWTQRADQARGAAQAAEVQVHVAEDAVFDSNERLSAALQKAAQVDGNASQLALLQREAGQLETARTTAQSEAAAARQHAQVERSKASNADIAAARLRQEGVAAQCEAAALEVAVSALQTGDEAPGNLSACQQALKVAHEHANSALATSRRLRSEAHAMLQRSVALMELGKPVEAHSANTEAERLLGAAHAACTDSRRLAVDAVRCAADVQAARAAVETEQRLLDILPACAHHTRAHARAARRAHLLHKTVATTAATVSAHEQRIAELQLQRRTLARNASQAAAGVSVSKAHQEESSSPPPGQELAGWQEQVQDVAAELQAEQLALEAASQYQRRVGDAVTLAEGESRREYAQVELMRQALLTVAQIGSLTSTQAQQQADVQVTQLVVEVRRQSRASPLQICC
jgi:hypothetical protein